MKPAVRYKVVSRDACKILLTLLDAHRFSRMTRVVVLRIDTIAACVIVPATPGTERSANKSRSAAVSTMILFSRDSNLALDTIGTKRIKFTQPDANSLDEILVTVSLEFLN